MLNQVVSKSLTRPDLSDRRACAVLSVARSTLGYQSRLAVRDAPALAVIRRLAAQYPRYGYRRIRIFLRREGHAMSPDRGPTDSGVTRGCRCGLGP